jgi:Tol biopolymer transport system component
MRWLLLAASTALLLLPAEAGGRERPLRILFASSRTGTLQIYSVDATGRNLRQLTFGSKGGCLPRPSPDGRRLAFFRGNCNELWLADADGRRPRRLAASASDASWSRDSQRLAYETQAGVFSARSDGSQRRRLTRDPGDRFPRLSSDGKLAVTRARRLWS